jgi:hypothetical protein
MLTLPPSRVAQLEQKIDGIVSLLTASQQIQQLSAAGLPLTPETIQATDQSNAAQSPVDMECGTKVPESILEDGDMPFSDSVDSTRLELLPGFRVTLEEADEYLTIYRKEILPYFPFVPVSPDIMAFELYSKHRFLFWAIISVTAPQSVQVQHAVKRWFRQWIAEHMVVRQEKRLEILQAMLIHLGW